MRGCFNTCDEYSYLGYQTICYRRRRRISRYHVPPCNCLSGFARNKDGICIPQDQCRPKPPPSKPCPVNEDRSGCFSDCVDGEVRTLCVRRRRDMMPGFDPPCGCKAGLARNSEGVCIPEADCKAKPPQVCENPNFAPVLCFKRCVEDAPYSVKLCTMVPPGADFPCACAKGSEYNGKCVKDSKCKAYARRARSRT